MKTAPAREITAVFNAALGGDESAKEYFKSLWTEDEKCWFCDEPSGPERSTNIIVDPQFIKNVCLVPICSACQKMDVKKRNRLGLRILRAMWPRANWHLTGRVG